MHNAFKQIPDLLEYAMRKLIILVLLRDNSKIPLDKGWNAIDYPIDKVVEHRGNLGILIAKGLCCIDIDGTSGSEPSTKKDSKSFLGKILKKAFPDAMIIRTASGGMHIYFWIDEGYEIEDAHRLSQSFQYPYDFPVEELRNAHLGFCKAKS